MVKLANWQSLARLASEGKYSKSVAGFKVLGRFGRVFAPKLPEIYPKFVFLADVYGQGVPHEGVSHALGDESGILVGRIWLRYQVERGLIFYCFLTHK